MNFDELGDCPDHRIGVTFERVELQNGNGYARVGDVEGKYRSGKDVKNTGMNMAEIDVRSAPVGSGKGFGW